MALLHRLRPLRSIGHVARAFSTTPQSRLAKMTVIGRLAAAPELSATATGNDIIKYSVACGYGPKDNRQTSWFKVGCFDQEGPRRDILLGMQKGTLVYVEGDARMNTYEDKEGVTRSSLAITQRHIEVLKRPEQAEGSNATS